jgi:hypothetical protein
MISLASCLLAVLMSHTGVSRARRMANTITYAPRSQAKRKLTSFWPLPYEFPTSCFLSFSSVITLLPGSCHLTPLILVQLVQSISFPFHFSRAKLVQQLLPYQNPAACMHKASSAPLSYHRFGYKVCRYTWPVTTQSKSIT